MDRARLWDLVQRWYDIAANEAVTNGTRDGYRECANQLDDLLGTEPYGDSDRIFKVAEFLEERNPGAWVNQVLKIQEEAGELAEAYLGFIDANPRKPTRPLSDVVNELCDVAIAALVALAWVDTSGWETLFSERLHVTSDRLIASAEAGLR